MSSRLGILRRHPRAKGTVPVRSQIKLLEGEEVAERMGDADNLLFLTNKRVIHLTKHNNDSVATVAFIKDIVSARVQRSARNRGYITAGVLLAIAGFVWIIAGGFGLNLNGSTTALILITDLILVLSCIALFITSGGTNIILKTANSEIYFPLGAGDHMYQFINRWLELKDKIG